MIIQETYELLRSKYNYLFQSTTIEKVVISIPNTMVKLSSGYCGIAKTEIHSFDCSYYNHKKYFGDFSPGKISGQKILDLFNYPENSEILSVVKLAVLNAVSAEIIEKSDYTIIEDKDPIDLIDLSGEKNICIVGAFQSYINKISNTSNKLFVLELNENAFSEEQKKYYVPAERASEIFAVSDIVIITGSTLANNTIDNLLKNIPSLSQTIVVGPTSSIIPDILFKYNVNIIGSTKIMDSEKAFAIISEAGAGFHLFKYCAKKICLINDSKKPIKQ